ncbi:hypothetical protein [Enterobacter cloacae]|uniref:hypothetical protein n=1 Tax=Enterobacter cloacae TaxID=550 RepID=UPI003F4890DF
MVRNWNVLGLVQKQTFSAEALGNEYATGVSRPAVLTTKTFLQHQRVTTEGKAMDKAYEEYFESLAEGDEALSFAEFVEALL